MTKEEARAYAKRVIDLGLNDETQAFCEVVLKALDQTRWIPVSERLPEFRKEVLTCSNGGFIEIQSLEDSKEVKNK